jgi:hypothetical protein
MSECIKDAVSVQLFSKMKKLFAILFVLFAVTLIRPILSASEDTDDDDLGMDDSDEDLTTSNSTVADDSVDTAAMTADALESVVRRTEYIPGGMGMGGMGQMGMGGYAPGYGMGAPGYGSPGYRPYGTYGSASYGSSYGHKKK